MNKNSYRDTDGPYNGKKFNNAFAVLTLCMSRLQTDNSRPPVLASNVVHGKTITGKFEVVFRERESRF